ncbi:MAG: type transporter [Herbinix sp.]|jgi:ABC-2 type transport system permease protein|nr:type transporter [Herbinix sp.]
MISIRRFLEQSWLNFKGKQAAFDLQEFVFLQTAYPIITLIFYCVIASYSFQTASLTRWVVGNSFLLCVNTCIFGLGMGFTGDRQNGRIRSIIVSPENKLLVVLESGFISSFMAMAMSLFGFFVGSLIFGVDFSGIHIGLFILITFIAMVSATGFGLLLSAFGLLNDSMHFILNTVSYLLIIFSGANFPVEQLPKATQFISKLIPLTRSIKAANMLFDEIDVAQLIRLLLSEMALGVIYILIAAVIIRIVERIAIRKATLEVF